MYDIYLELSTDSIPIHFSKASDPVDKVSDAVLELEENLAGSLTFTISPGNQCYNRLRPLISLISVRQNSTIIWTGRVISGTEDFWGRKKIVCEGALAFLNDSIQPLAKYSWEENTGLTPHNFLAKILDIHNRKVPSDRQLSLGTVTVENVTNFNETYTTQYNTTLDALKTQLLDRIGGHLVVTYNNSLVPIINYYGDYPKTAAQTINFGQNLLDFTKNWDLSDLATAIFPKGKALDDKDEEDDETTGTSSSSSGSSNYVTMISEDTQSLGTTTTNIKDNPSATIIKIDNKDHTATNGDLVQYNSRLYYFDDHSWHDYEDSFGSDDTMPTEDSIGTPLAPDSSEDEDVVEDDKLQDYVTVASVNNGDPFVYNVKALKTYGRIEKVVEFTDVDSPKTLLKLARLYLRVQQFDEMVIEISAVDLAYLSNNSDGAEDVIFDWNNAPVSFDLLDRIRCVSIPHGMDAFFPLKKISISINDPSQTKYTLGGSGSSSMSSRTANNDRVYFGKIANLISNKHVLDSAKLEAASILNAKTTGYVTITSENETSQALIISETPDWRNSDRFWKFNMNGLGYTKDGGKHYEIAITMDGTIVADFIKTGILSDGIGRNYWNLSTGDFVLHSTSKLGSKTVATVLNDLFTAQDTANTAKSTANTAKSTANSATKKATTANTNANTVNNSLKQVKTSFNLVKNRQYGVANLLNGSYKIAIPKNSSGKWASSNWKSVGSGNGKLTLLNCTKKVVGVNPVNAWIQKCVRISGSSNGKNLGISQTDVELENNTTYVLSCYARGTGKLLLQVGVTNRIMSLTKTLSNVNKWTRYSIVFTTNSDLTKKNYAGIKDGKLNVTFANSGTSANSYLWISAMKVEKGNTPTDWFPSVVDINNNAEEYTREYVEYQVPQATKEQVQLYDRQLTGAKVLGKLTKGYKHRGIYQGEITYNGKKEKALLINADYIRSGSMDAGIIRTGWIRDTKKKNEWNLVTGVFKTKSMQATDILAKGIFSSESTTLLSAVQISGGAAYFYSMTQLEGQMTTPGEESKSRYSKKLVSSVDGSGSMINVSNGKWHSCMVVRSKEGIDIRSPRLSVRNKNDNGVSIYAYNGTFKYNVVESIKDTGRGTIQWVTAQHGIEIVNGIIVSIW